MTEDDDSDVDRAENSKLMRLFEKPAFPFQKGPEGWLVHVRHANSISGGRGGGGWMVWRTGLKLTLNGCDHP